MQVSTTIERFFLMERVFCWLGIILLWALSAKMGSIAFSRYTTPAGHHILAHIHTYLEISLLSSCQLASVSQALLAPAQLLHTTRPDFDLQVPHLSSPALTPSQAKPDQQHTEQATLPPAEADTPCTPPAFPSPPITPL